MKWYLQATLTVLFVLLGALANVGPLRAAPAHPHPYLMPPAEKQRLTERLRSNQSARQQFETFQGTNVRISISPGEPLWFGLTTANEFENWWRSRKKKQASQ